MPTQTICLGWAFSFLNRAKFSCTLRKHETHAQENRILPAYRAGSDRPRLHAGDEQHVEPTLNPSQLIEY